MTMRTQILERGFALLVVLALCLIGVSWSAVPAAAQDSDDSQDENVEPASSDQCTTGVNAEPVRPRHVNLVLDDSGSMFSDGTNSLDRWSNAKYSLEVFASMLGSDDVLNVFRMSDFAETETAAPVVSVKGNEPASDRVAKIHDMQMQGGGTPYAPVTTAVADLASSSIPDKWLVVLTDGEFTDRETAQVESDLNRFVAENTGEASSLRVAFLALGEESPQLNNSADQGVFFERVLETSELLDTMTSFSNRIFARSLLPQSNPGQMNPDVDLDQILVFAQGGDVEVGELSVDGESIAPSSVVDVSWAENQDALNAGQEVPAVPNKDLRGTLASFEDIPSGTSVVGLQGAQTVDIFYTPRAAFGIELRDAQGERVEADKVVGGEYTVNYGFMDRDCEFIESDLFGDVDYTAQVIQDGEVITDAFAPGDALQLERGDAQFRVGASYLDGNTSEAVIDLRVLRPAKPTGFDVEQKDFLASQLQSYDVRQDGIKLHYAIHENGRVTDFSDEEWASFTQDSFSVESSEPDIDFELALGDAPGEVYLVPRAPGGVPIEAATGDIPVTISASHVYDEQLNEATEHVSVSVVDDYSWTDRFLHWFKVIGWLWLLLLLLFIWILGYFARPTFSRRIKQRPDITFKPRSRGRRNSLKGKFEKDRFGALIPYRARTATLTYAGRGFAPMTLRAKRGKKIEIVNWRAIAQRENVSINGEQLTKESDKAPMLRPSSSITSINRDGSYDMTLNT